MATITSQVFPRVKNYVVGPTPTVGPFGIPFTFSDNSEIRVFLDGIETFDFFVTKTSDFTEIGNEVTLDFAVSNVGVTVLSDTGAARSTGDSFVTSELSREIDRIFALFQESLEFQSRTVRLSNRSDPVEPMDAILTPDVALVSDGLGGFKPGPTTGEIAGAGAAAAAAMAAAVNAALSRDDAAASVAELSQLGVEITTLAAGAQATASYDFNTGILALGVPRGADGMIGVDGADGPQGPIGATGPVGPPAFVFSPDAPQDPIQGISWIRSADLRQFIWSGAEWISPLSAGAKGDTGETGATGPAGPQGLPGADGATGPQGPQGLTGETGLTGATGPAGPQGLTGPAGPAGADGLDGATGPAGPQGIQGIQGATGATGPQGPAGADGADGTSILTGATEIVVVGNGLIPGTPDPNVIYIEKAA